MKITPEMVDALLTEISDALYEASIPYMSPTPHGELRTVLYIPAWARDAVMEMIVDYGWPADVLNTNPQISRIFPVY